MNLNHCRIFFRRNRKRFIFQHRLAHVTYSAKKNDDIRRIRNIGIMAHIDAGKTTTTERMLFYSGKISQMGEVHHGNTTTDYLQQERDRGITITSASVTIPWLNHQINLIDTPGHIDFTFEVEQSLNVIDGAVIILDGSAGVEAQTVTVWNQADRYNIPRIMYINKMDRSDASLEFCLQSLKSRFTEEFLVLQIPIKGIKSGITAIVDVITKDLLTWSGAQGETVIRSPLLQSETLYEEVQLLRNQLIDKLADLDDELTDKILKLDSLAAVDATSVYDALKRVTLSRKGVPVLCGSSYKNVGVQKLMDAIVNILPSPDMRKDLCIYQAFNNNLCAKAFKVVHDKQRGPISFFRIYSGCMEKGQKLHYINKKKTESIRKLLIALADDYEEVHEINEGQIAAVVGLESVQSGDFVTNSDAAVMNAIRTVAKNKNISEEESERLLFPRISIPDPVFFRSVEAPSPSQQLKLDNALQELQREDPSLSIKTDPDTGQTILGGMGELHLEIIKDRILKQYKVDADLGPLQIAYKERVISSAKDCVDLDVIVGSNYQKVSLTMTILPRTSNSEEFITLDKSSENITNTSQITPKKLMLLKQGAENALCRGPKAGCPVLNASFIIHNLVAKKRTSESLISSAAAQCTRKLLMLTKTVLVEPIMRLEVVADDKHSSFVMSDLSHRRAEILDFSSRGHVRVIRALVPLAELLGYSNSLRTGTSGTAVFTMEFDSYRELNGVHESEAIKDITGFYPT